MIDRDESMKSEKQSWKNKSTVSFVLEHNIKSDFKTNFKKWVRVEDQGNGRKEWQDNFIKTEKTGRLEE